MEFIGEARKLTASDIETIAGYLGCEIAVVRAVLIVESANTGFGANGRPLILNEPHVLYRELSGADRDLAVRRQLAYKTWGTRPYPRTQNERYTWLLQAMAIVETAALRSCSWGMGQVMGFNHKICGFNTVQAFVRAQLISEGAHLYTMARFIVGNKLQRHLRNKAWASFARGYNGPGYAKNAYHTKLANAYKARPIIERIVPKPATETALFAMIAGASEPPPSPPVPVEPSPPLAVPVEPPADDLRHVQPDQPPPPTDHPWIAVLIAFATALAPVIAMLLQ